ncbi:MAG: extracellular solute-binding protein [Hungatella hathewayi]|nr:extracellular solute-binding protein [Hungatella hathewayi]
MKKRMWSMLISMVLAISVTGCGTSNNSNPSSTPVTEQASHNDNQATDNPPTQDTAGEEKVIRVVTGWNEASFPNWPEAIQKFEVDHPGIKVDIEYTPSGEDATTKIKAQLVAGNAPDIFQTWKVYFNDFAEAGYLTDLTDAYETYGFVEGTLMNGSRNWCTKLYDAANPAAKTYGVSDFICPSVFYYNTKIFNDLGLKEPTNLEELVQVSKKLKEAGIKPLVVPGATDNFLDILAKIQVQFTGVQYLLDVNNGKAKLTDESMMQAMNVLETLIKEEVIDASCISYTEDDCVAALANGSAAMFSMHSQFDNQLRAAQESNPDFQYSIIKGINFTENPVTKYSCTFGGCWVIPEKSQVKEEAKELLFYLFGEEVSEKSASEGGRITGMVEANQYLGSEALQVVVKNQLPELSTDSYYLIDMLPGSTATALRSGMQEILQGTGTAQTALENAQTVMDQVLQDK